MFLRVICLLFLASSIALADVVDSSTLDGKVIFGYQGWFTTPNDGANVGFVHWSKNPAVLNPSTVNFDIWPDLSEYPQSALEDTDLILKNGQKAKVFSSLKPEVTDLHFKWLQDYSLDGVFLQRFLGETADPRFFNIRNLVTTNVRAAAEKYGRVFAIMYDLSGLTDNGLLAFIQNDWNYLQNTLQVTQSPQYQKHSGKPVIALWGLGFTHINISPTVASQLISYFKGLGFYVIGGVPFSWRYGAGDSRADYGAVYQQFDALSPWAVGRYDNTGFQWAFNERVLDKYATYALGQYYAPVLFPGFSWANMNSPTAPFNQIPRLGGQFFWNQGDGMVNSFYPPKTFLYLAMFDEVDEGTALFKAAPTNATTPNSPPFVTLDVDGFNVPSDYYLQLAQLLTSSFKAATKAAFDQGLTL